MKLFGFGKKKPVAPLMCVKQAHEACVARGLVAKVKCVQHIPGSHVSAHPFLGRIFYVTCAYPNRVNLSCVEYGTEYMLHPDSLEVCEETIRTLQSGFPASEASHTTRVRQAHKILIAANLRISIKLLRSIYGLEVGSIHEAAPCHECGEDATLGVWVKVNGQPNRLMLGIDYIYLCTNVLAYAEKARSQAVTRRKLDTLVEFENKFNDIQVRRRTVNPFKPNQYVVSKNKEDTEVWMVLEVYGAVGVPSSGLVNMTVIDMDGVVSKVHSLDYDNYRRFVLEGGNVISRNDGQRHYICQATLRDLYGVPSIMCRGLVGNKRDDDKGPVSYPGDVVLRPRYKGDYVLQDAINGNHIAQELENTP